MPRMTGAAPESTALATACVGNLETRSDVRDALTAMLKPPLRQMLDINWVHYDDITADILASRPIHALVAVPDTSTWSRARYMNKSGPPILRSAQWPWGLPHTSGGHREIIEAENDSLRHCLLTIEKALSVNPDATVLFLAPEDRGASPLGRPASIWQLKELREWARRRELRRGAAYQCEIGASSTPRPLGILMHRIESGDVQRRSPIKRGWPRFSPKPDGHYVGPMSRTCACNSSHAPQLSKAGDRRSIFSSLSVAKGLMKILLRPHLRKRLRSLGLLRQGSLQAQLTMNSEGTSWDTKEIGIEEETDSDRTWPEPSSSEGEQLCDKDLQLCDKLNDGYSNEVSLSSATSPPRKVAPRIIRSLSSATSSPRKVASRIIRTSLSGLDSTGVTIAGAGNQSHYSNLTQRVGLHWGDHRWGRESLTRGLDHATTTA